MRKILTAILFIAAIAHAARADEAHDEYIRQVDELSALWSYYKHTFIQHGRVISHDEKDITTSEGQSYALLRAVWANDPLAFAEIWSWTKANLQVRQDRLFAWKWKDKVIDSNSATDGDTDIALALILASRKFQTEDYARAALEIVRDIWRVEVVKTGNGKPYITGGNWAPFEESPMIHVAYFAPYAYDVFAGVDTANSWHELKTTSYDVLHWIYFEKKLPFPPAIVFLNKKTGELDLTRADHPIPADFGYDDVPIYWRVAIDSSWFGTREDALRDRMLDFYREEWKRRGKFLDRYDLKGQPRSDFEGLPLYASVAALAYEQSDSLGPALSKKKLSGLFKKALEGEKTPYYLHNWLWFQRALQLNVSRHFDEFLGFLRPFDFESFSTHFPWIWFGLLLLLYPFSMRYRICRLGVFAIGVGLCSRYLAWRLHNTLNFMEPMGPMISLAFWLAEAYCFSTVLLLVVQVGFGLKEQEQSPLPSKKCTNFPAVDIFIPIFSEPLPILEATLIGTLNIDYPNKTIYVCDDSRQEAVRVLAERLGAIYVEGPKKHAKAGNMNNALTKSSADLVLIFDTDHIPASNFLTEIVPLFDDPKIGFVQTPHHFYNEDIFQRAFLTADQIPNDQDSFGHAIQTGRDSWGGAFFVGSGAVFRRSAIQSVGGFNTMSITEDIHTSQHLHAKGWRSGYVNKDIAFGLTAENFASYLVQRRRWMLGCLQIFFKDNPLFLKGLSLRQRIGYFASLYYFFYPAARVVFMVTPLAFLLFHWHPMFADVSVLMAYLIPSLIALPLLSNVLIPGWPRLFWGTIYENAISFPLFRSMFDLFLPKNLGFKVTPKGIRSDRRAFDFSSSRLTLIVAGLVLFAIGKGYSEFFFFQIEKDAYFFNLSWAIFNFLSLAMGLYVAWEKPQRRAEERLKLHLPVEFISDGRAFGSPMVLHDISLSGVGLTIGTQLSFPKECEVLIKDGSGIRLPVSIVYNRKLPWRGGFRVGMKFLNLSEEKRRQLFLHLFCNPKHWEDAHAGRARTSIGMGVEFFKALARMAGL